MPEFSLMTRIWSFFFLICLVVLLSLPCEKMGTDFRECLGGKLKLVIIQSLTQISKLRITLSEIAK